MDTKPSTFSECFSLQEVKQ